MSRDQRVNDNWALLFAQEIALKQHMPMNYPAAELRGIWNTEYSSQKSEFF
jgi:deoxyribodipyrimidine photolyase